MRVLQINTTLNTGSTGRIAEEIGETLLGTGWESFIAHGRPAKNTRSVSIKIGNQFDQQLHGLQTRIFDNHAFASKAATGKLISQIEKISPSLVHLHNLHGYYLHVEVLFNWLKRSGVPVVWTFHDCWPFTGHCTFFDSVGCEKWKTVCNKCPKTRLYPSSFLFDRSTKNYTQKKKLFNMPTSMHIVTPSQWLAKNVQQSFLNNYPCTVIYNGVDLKRFHPEAHSHSSLLGKFSSEKIVLGVASTWDKRKGLDDFIKLSTLLPGGYKIVLVGLDKEQLSNLPTNIEGIERTESVEDLAALYAAAAVFVNPTWQDNFPTTNIEALACGTPVITYNTGGSIEAVDNFTGAVIQKGAVEMLANEIKRIASTPATTYIQACRTRAEIMFDKQKRYGDYLQLYRSLIK